MASNVNRTSPACTVSPSLTRMLMIAPRNGASTGEPSLPTSTGSGDAGTDRDGAAVDCTTGPCEAISVPSVDSSTSSSTLTIYSRSLTTTRYFFNSNTTSHRQPNPSGMQCPKDGCNVLFASLQRNLVLLNMLTLANWGGCLAFLTWNTPAPVHEPRK